jgi:aspartyl-tRNA synthetase
LWVLDFPLPSFTRNRTAGTDHPFTAPVARSAAVGVGPEKVRGQHYDVVVNSVELGGARLYSSAGRAEEDLRELLQIAPEETGLRFSYLSKRSSGARRTASRSGSTVFVRPLRHASIRDVIAFPKTAKGTCLMTDSPPPSRRANSATWQIE